MLKYLYCIVQSESLATAAGHSVVYNDERDEKWWTIMAKPKKW